MTKTKAMLAHKYNPDKADYPAFIQPKLDGVRCLFTAEGAFSRAGNQFMNVDHIEQALKPYFASNPTAVLDGELYNHDLRDNFEKIISLVRKQKPTKSDKLEAKKLVQFHCYDYIDQMHDYSTRMNHLVTTDMYSYCVKYVETSRVRSKDAAQLRHQYNLNNGYEGSILRLDGPYQCKRSYNLQKFKDFHDTEATIVGYEEGKGKRKDTLGKFLMQDDDGKHFGCPPGKGYTYRDLTIMLHDIHKYMGQRATFTYFERTKAGSYRHPLFKCLRNYE